MLGDSIHQPTNTRNEALEFARRTRRNLEFIENAAETGAHVHVVIQLTISLLGLVVLPKERLLFDRAEGVTLADMRCDGWPKWSITVDDEKHPAKTLAQIITHSRNAIAHGRLTFTSDSPRLEEVAIIVEDKRRRRDAAPYWCAQIDAKDLRSFCSHFLDFIEDTCG